MGVKKETSRKRKKIIKPSSETLFCSLLFRSPNYFYVTVLPPCGGIRKDHGSNLPIVADQLHGAVCLEKLTVRSASQTKFPAFYGITRFIIVFTEAATAFYP
jgi:hypothetical protein